jgi:hypothetical protein
MKKARNHADMIWVWAPCSTNSFGKEHGAVLYRHFYLPDCEHPLDISVIFYPRQVSLKQRKQ